MISMRCLLISSLLLIRSAPAFAERKISERARVELVRGEENFRQRDYAAAITAFDAGYAIDPQPIFLYDKAQAQRLAGDCKSAIDTYRAFLATQPPHNEATRAQKNIDNCEATLPPPPRVDPPPVPAVVDAEPAPFETVVEPVQSEVPPQSVHRTRDAWWSDGIGITLVTTGVIGLGLGTGFAVAARAAADETELTTNIDNWSATNRRWERDKLIATIAVGSGAVLVATGLLRLTLRDRSVAITPTSGDGALVSVGGNW
jgi:hypothetical protein